MVKADTFELIPKCTGEVPLASCGAATRRKGEDGWIRTRDSGTGVTNTTTRRHKKKVLRPGPHLLCREKFKIKDHGPPKSHPGVQQIRPNRFPPVQISATCRDDFPSIPAARALGWRSLWAVSFRWSCNQHRRYLCFAGILLPDRCTPYTSCSHDVCNWNETSGSVS